jgi:hypothetical protein
MDTEDNGSKIDYFLSKIFAIDIAAYAIQGNHYHVVLHIDQQKAEAWSIREVCNQWHQLFSGFSLSNRYLAGESLSNTEDQQLNLKVEEWRQRLIDISGFMRCLNDKIIWNDFEQLCWP